MNGYFTADVHAHPSLPAYLFGRDITCYRKPRPGLSLRATRTNLVALRRGGVRLVWSSLMVPEHEMFQQCLPLRWLGRLFLKKGARVIEADPTEEVFRAMDEIEGQLSAAADVQVVRSVAELDSALAQGHIAFVHTVEGGHVLGSGTEADLDKVNSLAERGVASMTLGHFFVNALVPPAAGFPKLPPIDLRRICNFQFGVDPEGSLTEFGEAVVKRMSELGMIVDLTHCPRPARLRVLELLNGKAPVVATHCGAWALNRTEMNLRDDEILKIKRCGGLVGVIFMNYWLGGTNKGPGLPFIVETIRHLARAGSETGGECFDHIALGTDFDGFSVVPSDLTDAAAFPKVAEALVSAGLQERDVRKIMGENALRVLRCGWR